MPAELEVGVDPFSVSDEPELLEPPNLGLCEVVKREVRERGATPQRKRALQQVPPLLGRKPPRIDERALEPTRVELVGCEAEDIARRAGLEHVRAEDLPEAGDRVLQGRCRSLRCVLAPQEIDESVHRDHAPDVEQEDGQKAALPVAAERDRPGLVRDLERAEYPELERHIRP